MPMGRRLCRAFAAIAIGLLAARAASAADATPVPSLTVLGFELIEEHPNPALAADQARRIAALDRQLREGLAEAGLYRLVDETSMRAVVDELKTKHEYLYRCVECAQVVGLAAQTDLVLMGWVQKVSELILNINIELHSVAGDRVVLAKSVDLRGNTDESWRRGLRFMLRDWAERRARDPGYGR
jgi:hypothetical protein